MAGPLEGVRVLDLTSVVMGPYATQLLGDYGADVIKVESPEGDVMRQSGPMRNPRMGHLYLTTNRSKRSVSIDLKSEAGREVLLRLARNADALVYNIRPQAMARLGLAWEDLAAVNPRIVYVGAFGFSQRGPYAARPAYDDLIQGMSGIPWLSHRAGAEVPRYAPMILADRVVGLQVAFAISSALVHRERTGQGQRVDVPMFEGLLSLVLGEHLAGRLFEPPQGPEGYQRSLTPDRRPYRTRDGYLCTLIYTDKHWRAFFDAIGQPAMFDEDARFSSQGARAANIDAVYGYLSGVLATRSTDEWLELFASADLPAARMYSIDDVIGDRHLAATGFLRKVEHPSEGTITEIAVPTEWSASKPELARHAPRLGEHSVEVLREAGYAQEEIDALLGSGAVRAA
jgi:crotonobetainyl-CoA:carnitine CoA-transferase CaiB-like acyl-CoA transferase